MTELDRITPGTYQLYMGYNRPLTAQTFSDNLKADSLSIDASAAFPPWHINTTSGGLSLSLKFGQIEGRMGCLSQAANAQVSVGLPAGLVPEKYFPTWNVYNLTNNSGLVYSHNAKHSMALTFNETTGDVYLGAVSKSPEFQTVYFELISNSSYPG